ncbi:hypothetical protein [Vibrio vulnificus]|uniref:hypothetical protein n=1 Tax=Vibrio vulnificus TaxID=672 RepID=UPI003EDA28D9
MSRKDSKVRAGFKSRASLARSKNQSLSYKERLAMSSKDKDVRKVDFGNVDESGYIKML